MSVTYNITNIVPGSTTGNKTITIIPASGYSLPSSITVTNGTLVSYDSSTGIAVISGDDAVISAECVEAVAGNPYLTFSSPNTFTLNIVDNIKYWDGTLQYSVDAQNWITWNGTSAISSSQSGTTKYLYMRGSNNTVITGSSASDSKARWVLTGSDISCDGNIETLLDYQTVVNGNHPSMGTYCFAYMFWGSTSLTTPPALPATSLTGHCYHSMFYSCTNLTTAPALPATTLTDYCYYYMFYNCTSLTTPPALPATSLATYCYSSMFRNCAALTTVPELPATTLASYCYYYMFYGCTALTTAPALPATTLASYCYFSMFRGCIFLGTAPVLPATTLASYCYGRMFQGCTNLTTPAIMAGGTTQATAAKQCCYRMYYGCSPLHIYSSSSGHIAFYKALAYSTSSSDTNYQSSYEMFYNCYLDGSKQTTNYLTAGTQYYY